MSDRPNAIPSKQIPRPSPPPEAERPNSDTSSMEGGVYRCTCGIPDGSRKWIYCDNDACPMGWYHWACVGVTEKPQNEWLCPKCSSSSVPSTRKAEEVQERGPGAKTTPTSSEVGKTAGTGPRGVIIDRDDKKGGQRVAKQAPVRMKKGTAIKKVLPKKKKIGWVETSSSESEGDDGDKESVEAARKAITGAEGRRTRARATHSKRAQTLRRTSKLAAGVKGKARAEPKIEG
ncbi:MAG: hypothetical protein Q9161_003238 [Pseudevernia consocians]